jgi:hypothetical protein
MNFFLRIEILCWTKDAIWVAISTYYAMWVDPWLVARLANHVISFLQPLRDNEIMTGVQKKFPFLCWRKLASGLPHCKLARKLTRTRRAISGPISCLRRTTATVCLRTYETRSIYPASSSTQLHNHHRSIIQFYYQDKIVYETGDACYVRGSISAYSDAMSVVKCKNRWPEHSTSPVAWPRRSKAGRLTFQLN